ncbi:MAG: formylglycine-generating enzyme family protein [Deltaproteobacteria bacterium]|nr:formylglycine-generating enzyme family protein [Deltaproteobacteria bacterium]
MLRTSSLGIVAVALLSTFAGCTPAKVAQGLCDAMSEEAIAEQEQWRAKFASGQGCRENRLTEEPDVVGWDQVSKQNLLTLAQEGLVVVRYQQKRCLTELRVLTNCISRKASYKETPTSGSRKRIAALNDHDLYANFPVGVGDLQAKMGLGCGLVAEFELKHARMMPIGTVVKAEELEGNEGCAGATHVVSTIYSGSFAIGRGSRSVIGAGVGVLGVSSSQKMDVFESSTDAPVRLTLLPIKGEFVPACGKGLGWDEARRACVAAEDTSCRPGLHFEPGQGCVPDEHPRCDRGFHLEPGQGCVPDVSEKCSAGFHLVAGQGCVPDMAPRPAAVAPAAPRPEPPAPPPPAEDMVLVPAGDFWMGCAPQDWGCGDDNMRHQVYLDAFYIDRTEVTVAQYRSCVNARGCTADHLTEWGLPGSLKPGEECNWNKSGRDSHPINCVDWSQAEAYCRFAGKRLPTEAEWEKAARGTDGRIYPWGSAAPSCHYAVMDDGGHGCGRDSTSPVGSKPAGASPYGALDMAGNVWEWTADWYGKAYYAASPERNPTGPSGGSLRVLRGRSWDLHHAMNFRASKRDWFVPEDRSRAQGFRCARPAG